MLRGLKTFANHFEKLDYKVARESEKCQKRLAQKEANGEPVKIQDEFRKYIFSLAQTKSLFLTCTNKIASITLMSEIFVTKTFCESSNSRNFACFNGIQFRESA